MQKGTASNCPGCHNNQPLVRSAHGRAGRPSRAGEQLMCFFLAPLDCRSVGPGNIVPSPGIGTASYRNCSLVSDPALAPLFKHLTLQGPCNKVCVFWWSGVTLTPAWTLGDTAVQIRGRAHFVCLHPFLSSVTQSHLTLCDPMECSPPGSSVHGIFQARILVWVAISSSRGSSQPRSWIWVSSVSCIGRQILYHWATWEALLHL